ncbi:MAG: family 78 glycoside hydrolase catalytic domain [Ruminiclostridium sp.]|nr:family 78 glycoside hydrolase catalytic domain [Ruminiclostridium sp.]
MKKWKAKWVVDEKFAGLQPGNLFSGQEPAGAAHREDLQNYHMLARKTFTLADKPRKVFLDISADDCYKLYINGIFTAQGPAPGYPFHYYFNRLDVTRYLHPGMNVIAVHVYYQGLVNRVWCSADYRQGFIAELFSTEGILAKTDHTWKYIRAAEYATGEPYGYATQYPELIDNRLKAAGWKEEGFDDSSWLSCVENDKDDHVLFLQPTPVVTVYETRPQITRYTDEGDCFLDFGRELTSHLEMKAIGKSGQKVEIMYGEELNEDGTVRYNMRCNCLYRDIWTLAEGTNEFEPYDYKAFRYVQIKAPDSTVLPDSIKVVTRHYPMQEESCRFSSSSPLLNGIWDICKNAVRLGCQEVYTDCPSREKGQYLGDATVTALSHLYLTGDLSLYKKNLEDFARSARFCPGLTAVAPCSYKQEIADYSLLWPWQLLNYYRHSGDKSFLKRMLPTAEGILHYFRRFEREDGLLENVTEKWNLVDWPETMRDGYDFNLERAEGCHNVINALYLGAVKTVDEIREALGLEASKRIELLKEAFHQAFYRKANGLFADSIDSDHCAVHSNIYPLFYGFASPATQENIVQFIRTKGLACGVYTAFFLLKGVARAGAHDLVYQLLTSTDRHSWANMLAEGATACFEAWGKELKWNTSLCHPWASAPIPVIIEDLLGVTPEAPGWETIRFKPHLPHGVEEIALEFTTRKGRICVRADNGKATMNLLTKRNKTR